MLLKEDGNVLRTIFKIILLLNNVIYVTFYTCSNRNAIYHFHVCFSCCFINFYKDCASNYLVLMVFRLFLSYKLLLDIYVYLKFSRISYLLY